MSDVLQLHQHIIDQVVPVLRSPDFDELFKALTAKIPKPHQFQLKMEVNRLKLPCSRIIDLRGHVDGTVEVYEHDKRTHHMDAKAIAVFEKELSHFGDYTTGVYEKVQTTENNFRVMHQKEQQQRLAKKEQEISQKQQRKQPVIDSPLEILDGAVDEDETIISYNAKKVQFQSYAIRSEERMNYSITIEVDLPAHEPIKTTSTDLSVSGCKIKLPLTIEVQSGQLLRLHFRGLEEEFTLGIDEGMEYEIVAADIEESFQYVRLKRTYSEDTQAFDEFLGNFINGNKRRYKVNMENTEDAVIIKGYEQYYIPRVITLPVYLSKTNNQFIVRAILTTENNKHDLRYWRNELQQIVLPNILTTKRINALLEQTKESILYSFTHSRNGTLHHYAAFEQELESNESLKQLFFGFGAAKKNWRVHKVQLLDANYDKAHIPLSLPDTAGEEVKQLNKPPSARVQRVLQDTSHIVALTDITEVTTKRQYRTFKFDAAKANELKVFGVVRVKNPINIEVVAVDYVNLRKETRFLYKTPATIEAPGQANVSGSTRDFSTKGVQIELTSPATIEKGEIVLVNFPEMQKLTRKFKLTRLPYEAVAISKNKLIVNVRVYEHGERHNGKKFFQQLIQTNRSKLTAAEEMQTIPGLPLAMRNMYVSCCANMPFYVHRKGIRYMINTIGLGGQDNSLHHLMEKFKEPNFDYHLQPLVMKNLVETFFATTLKNMKRQDPPSIRELLIRVKRNAQSAKDAISIELSNALHKETSRRAFIEATLEEDLLFAYRIYISRTGRPDVDYIAKELKYVGNYAIHRAKVLEEELWGVIGVGDAIDITDEMMARYGYTETDIMIQKQARKFYFSQTTDFNL